MLEGKDAVQRDLDSLEQCAPTAWKASCILEYIKRTVASTLREVVLFLFSFKTSPRVSAGVSSIAKEGRGDDQRAEKPKHLSYEDRLQG